jgi:carbamoyltransferase
MSSSARSAPADPGERAREMQATMNVRSEPESFRPFAPSVREERCADYFELDRESPYMLLVAPVRAEALPIESRGERARQAEASPLGRCGITHVDGSARVQTVREDQHAEFYGLLKEFDRQTGCPVLINTSFNVRGEPIVCTPEDAYRCFLATNMDVLVLETSAEERAAGAKEIDVAPTAEFGRRRWRRWSS